MRKQPIWIITQREEKFPSHTKEGQYDLVFYNRALLGNYKMPIKEFLQYTVNLAQRYSKGLMYVNVPSTWDNIHIHLSIAYNGLAIGTEATKVVKNSDGTYSYVQEGKWYASGIGTAQKAGQLFTRLQALYLAKYNETLKLPAGDDIWDWSEIPEIRYSKALLNKYPPTDAEIQFDLTALPYAFQFKENKFFNFSYKETVDWWMKKIYPDYDPDFPYGWVAGGAIALILAIVFFFLRAQ